MNILISINDEFVDVVKDMLYSVHMYNKEKLKIYLIYENLSDKNIKKLKEFIKQNKIGELYTYYYDFSDKNFEINIPHISRETYFRLFAPYILPKEIDRILYLDGDIICNGSLKRLYNMPFDGNIFIAAENIDPDPEFIPWINNRLELPIDNIYFNAGVLLINMEEFRKFTSQKNLTNFIDKNMDKIWCQDQDVINKMFNGKIKKMNNTYNYPINHINADELEYNKKMVHYLSPPKPWKNDYDLPFHGVAYYKYLMKTGQLDKLNKLLNKHIRNAKLDIYLVRELLDLIFDNYD